MNQQNKIYGSKFATVGIVANDYDGKEKYELDDKGIIYVLNKSTLAEVDIDDTFVEDFIKQMADIGTIGEIRLQLGMEDYGGHVETEIVLRHNDLPHVMAHVQVKSAPKNFAPHPRSFQYPNDFVFHCYYDEFTYDNSEKTDMDDGLDIFNALANNGIGTVSVE